MSDETIIKVTVLGNCGVVHSSVEEWQQCKACDRPPVRHYKPWFRDVMQSFVEKKNESR